MSRARASSWAPLSVGLAIVLAVAACSSLAKVDVGAPSLAPATTPIATPTSAATATPPITPDIAVATATPTVETTPPEPATTQVPASGPTGPTGKTTAATVVRVVDGDTIVVAYGGTQYKVRYIGMNTPETVDPSSPVQWMGPEASAANKLLVTGKAVVLEKDVSETDRYGRLLRYVWLTDGAAWTLVNLELIKEGFASVSTYPPDVKYVDDYLAAEQEAQASAIGLWGDAPIAELVPPPAATAAPKPPATSSKCHPSYTPCLPIVADLNCPAVRAMGKAPVTVIGPDAYRLDGNHDGVGCE